VKFFALLIVVVVGIWWFRNRQVQVHKAGDPPQPATPQDMLRCTQCGIHLPDSEAIKGRNGSYCCQDHLRQAEH